MIRLSDSLTLPADAVTQTFAFLARRGAGKSYGAMKLAEGMLDANAQIVAIDPVGVWFSLRIAADGKGKGFPILVFGGLHGDLPLEPGAGAFIADLIVDRGISAVLDVSHFRKNDRKRFATDFAEQLFHRKKQRRTPIHLFVEEAQVFIPQRVMGDEARMLGAFEDIIKLGRNFGIGATLVSQRPQAVNKDALNQTEALFVLQTNGAQERKALENWIVEQGVATKGLVDELPSLPIGTAFLWSPSWLRKLEKVKIGKRKTYDASATPVAGVEHVEPRPLSVDELADVEKAMAATIERAKADDPKALRAKITELGKLLVERGAADPAEAAQLRARVAELEAEVADLRDDALAAEDRAEAAEEAITAARNILGPVPVYTPRAEKPSIPARPVATVKPQTAPLPLVTSPRPTPPRAQDGSLGGGPMKILAALAGTRDGRATRTQLGMLAGFSAGGGTFAKYLSQLRSADLVAGDGSTLSITAGGRERVGQAVPAVTTAEVHTMWRNKLGGGPRKMLDALLARWPEGLSKAELGNATAFEPSGGTYAKYLSTLSGLDLVERRGGTLVATDALFPTGPVR
jgi:hypothetical protein